MSRSFLAKLFTLALTSFALSACSGGGGGGSTPSANSPPPDITAPIITLNGSATLYLFLEEVYTELNATALDNVDGDLSSIISIAGTVDVNTAESYTLTYSATDTAGNTGIATRTVVVRLKGALNDTGITWGGNYTAGNNTGCTGETIGEQDCSHGRDADGSLVKVGGGMAGFDFTKLDSTGVPLAASATSWTCVKDNHTGLIWEVKTADASRTNLHSMDDRFNWYNTDSATNGGEVGFDNDDGNICTDYNIADASTHCNTQAFVARVNTSNSGTGLCGATDWRLPNLNELQSIAHLGKPNPAIDENYFSNSGSNFYWSSSPDAEYSNYTWGISFGSGFVSSSYRNLSYSVRLVRVGQ